MNQNCTVEIYSRIYVMMNRNYFLKGNSLWVQLTQSALSLLPNIWEPKSEKKWKKCKLHTWISNFIVTSEVSNHIIRHCDKYLFIKKIFRSFSIHAKPWECLLRRTKINNVLNETLKINAIFGWSVLSLWVKYNFQNFPLHPKQLKYLGMNTLGSSCLTLLYKISRKNWNVCSINYDSLFDNMFILWSCSFFFCLVGFCLYLVMLALHTGITTPDGT